MNRFLRPSEIKILFAFVLASVLASSLAQRYLGHVEYGADGDFYDYYFAAQTVHDNPHAALYEGATGGNPQLRSAPTDSELFAHAKAASFHDVELYLYPPLLADLLAPVSTLPARVAAALWRVFNLGLILASVALISRMVRVPILSFGFAAFSIAAFSFWPVHEALSDGQIAIVMLALWTIGVAAYFDECVILSASAFALATAFKVTPILLLPVLIIWKDRRWLMYYLAVSLGLFSTMVAINSAQNMAAYAGVLSAMGSGVPAVSNKSISSLVAWAYYGRTFTMSSVHGAMASPPRALPIVEKALSGAFYLFCLFLAWRSRHLLGRASRAAMIAVFGLVTACVSPVSWRHGYAVAIIPLAIFWARALRSQPRAFHAVLLALTTFTIGSLFFDLAAEAAMPQICRILLAATWVVFSGLFALDVLFHADASGDGEAWP